MAAEMKRRIPFLAAVLSFLAPGLGQIYNGKGALGLIFFLVSLALPICGLVLGWPRRFIGLVALALVAIVFWLFTVIHAFFQAHRIKQIELKKYQKTAVYTFFIILSLGLTFLVPIKAWASMGGISPYRIATGAMMPTLQVDDLIMAATKAYRDSGPKRGDLVVFDYPADPTKQFVKRVIGLEGDRIEIRDKQVYINSEPIEEPYKVHVDTQIYTKTDNRPLPDIVRDNIGPLEIPAGHCFVL